MTSPEQLLELALKSGAEAAEVFQSTSRSTPVSFEANRLKQVENIEADGVALRLWRNGQPGLAVAYGEVELQALVDRALALSQLNVPEERQLTPIAHPKYPTAGKVVPVQQLVGLG
jgi:PmbA protein